MHLVLKLNVHKIYQSQDMLAYYQAQPKIMKGTYIGYNEFTVKSAEMTINSSAMVAKRYLVSEVGSISKTTFFFILFTLKKKQEQIVQSTPVL